MIGLFYQSKSPPLIRELPLNDSLARSGVVGVPDPLALGNLGNLSRQTLAADFMMNSSLPCVCKLSEEYELCTTFTFYQSYV